MSRLRKIRRRGQDQVASRQELEPTPVKEDTHKNVMLRKHAELIYLYSAGTLHLEQSAKFQSTKS